MRWGRSAASSIHGLAAYVPCAVGAYTPIHRMGQGPLGFREGAKDWGQEVGHVLPDLRAPLQRPQAPDLPGCPSAIEVEGGSIGHKGLKLPSFRDCPAALFERDIW